VRRLGVLLDIRICRDEKNAEEFGKPDEQRFEGGQLVEDRGGPLKKWES